MTGLHICDFYKNWPQDSERYDIETFKAPLREMVTVEISKLVSWSLRITQTKQNIFLILKKCKKGANTQIV